MLNKLFGRASRLSPDDREAIIRYLVAEWTLRAEQDDAAGEYNADLTKHGSSMSPGGESVRAVAASASRMAQVNRQLVEKHRELSPVPDQAGKCYFLWHGTYLALSEWASAAEAGYGAIADGGMPFLPRVQQLLKEEEKCRREALQEEERLMRSLSLTPEEARQIMAESEKGMRYT